MFTYSHARCVRVGARPAYLGGQVRLALPFVFALLFASPLWSTGAKAHPVAQGAMRLQVTELQLTLAVFPSEEEISVHAVAAGSPDVDRSVQRQAYAVYVHQHLRVAFDDQLLPLTLHSVGVNTAQPFTFTAQLPANTGRIVFTQDCLREFEFAPGNPWQVSYLLSAVARDGTLLAEVLLASDQAVTLDVPLGKRAAAQPLLMLLRSYFIEGVRHVVAGWDHLLFALALVLSASTVRQFLKVVTAFTLAHSLTLVLTSYGVLRIEPRLVEPLIALSIVWVALENVVRPVHAQRTTRVVAAFVFGLFHGLGFAGGLQSAVDRAGSNQLAWALLAFTLGVEVGHQVVIIPGYLFTRWTRSSGVSQLHARLVCYGSLVIGAAGVTYLVAALR